MFFVTVPRWCPGTRAGVTRYSGSDFAVGKISFRFKGGKR